MIIHWRVGNYCRLKNQMNITYEICGVFPNERPYEHNPIVNIFVLVNEVAKFDRNEK